MPTYLAGTRLCVHVRLTFVGTIITRTMQKVQRTDLANNLAAAPGCNFIGSLCPFISGFCDVLPRLCGRVAYTPLWEK